MKSNEIPFIAVSLFYEEIKEKYFPVKLMWA